MFNYTRRIFALADEMEEAIREIEDWYALERSI
jgi:hypothetical protein